MGDNTSDIATSYDDAVKRLFKSNTKVLDKDLMRIHTRLTKCYLNRLGMQVEDIDKLNPIHIAGTKGKGSTSAMCESILRAKGYKTGLFTSPHLLEARERIRINGKPISKETFVKYFWEVTNKLSDNVDCFSMTDLSPEQVDPFPIFLTYFCLIAFKIFFDEKVDVAVIEVIIGGADDPTNIIRNPKACAITNLGLDHTNLLGNTMKDIAWHKSGIFKPGSPAITTSQPNEALDVIRERAKELGASSLIVAPKFSDYPNHVISLGINGDHQLLNASLAVQVCNAWLNEMGAATDQEEKNNRKDHHYECGIPIGESFTLPPEFIKGLTSCKWPGRCQIIENGGATYFFDCAHTNRSIRFCADWFKKESVKHAEKNKPLNTVRVLLFHFTGARNGTFLMEPLLGIDFDHSAFCPNIVNDVSTPSAPVDTFTLTTTPDQLVPRARANASLWKQLHEQHNTEYPGVVIPKLTNEPLMFESIPKAVQWIQGSVVNNDSHVQVLVCGSSYLVGGVMKYLGYDTESISRV